MGLFGAEFKEKVSEMIAALIYPKQLRDEIQKVHEDIKRYKLLKLDNLDPYTTKIDIPVTQLLDHNAPVDQIEKHFQWANRMINIPTLHRNFNKNFDKYSKIKFAEMVKNEEFVFILDNLLRKIVHVLPPNFQL